MSIAYKFDHGEYADTYDERLRLALEDLAEDADLYALRTLIDRLQDRARALEARRNTWSTANRPPATAEELVLWGVVDALSPDTLEQIIRDAADAEASR